MAIRGVDWNHSPSKVEDREKQALIADLLRHRPPPDVLSYPALEAKRRKIAKQFAGVRKVLVLSDLHIPYQRMDLIGQALERDGDADLGILAGDFLHMGAFGKFSPQDTNPFADEWEQAISLLGTLTAMMPWVMIRANHERRLEKVLDALPAEGLRWVRERLPNLIDALVSDSGQPNLTGIYDWWCRIGQAAICHADEFSSIHSRSVTNVIDFFQAQRLADVNVVVQAHTHHVAKLVYKGNLGIECGCLCHPQDYVFSGKLGPGRKECWHAAYAVLYFDGHGHCDWNRSGFHYFGDAYRV